MSTLGILSFVVATAALCGWISSRVLRMPNTIGTMLLTVLATAAVNSLAFVTPGLHTWAEHLAQSINFESLIMHGMLPLLLFAGAFLLDIEHLAREKFPVAVLSVAGTILSFLAVAFLMKLLAGNGAPWMECLLFGALISPTDPIAVLELLRRVGIRKSVEAQLAGESLFNDGIGAVLFITMIEIAQGQNPTPSHIAGLLLLKAGGALALGVAAAWVVSHLMRLVDEYQVEILLTLTLALGGYVVAELLHASPPLEAVVAGIALRSFNRRQPAGRIADEQVDKFWTLLDELQNSLLFVLLGLEAIVFTVDSTTVRSGAAAIFSVNVVRLAVVALCLGFVRFCVKKRVGSIPTLTWGGLRGGLSIALALSVPERLGRSWIFGATYTVVVFSILLQGGSMGFAFDWRRRRNARLARSAPEAIPE